MRKLLGLMAALLVLATVAGAQNPRAYFPPVSSTGTFPFGVAVTFGNDMAAIGDVDGDGITDYAIADAGFHGNQTVFSLLDIGAVHVFSGTGNPATLITSFHGSNGLDYFGWSIAAIDDLNGDGAMEFAVGAVALQTGLPYVRIIDPVNGPLLTIGGPAGVGYFGIGVASTADRDGDGYRDLIVTGGGWAGLYGSQSGSLLASQNVNASQTIFTKPQALVVADLNGDGIEDFISGDPYQDRIDVYDGSISNFGVSFDKVVGPAGSRIGVDIAYLGSFANGAHVAIGRPLADTVEVWTMLGGSATQLASFSGSAGSEYGTSLAAVGMAGTLEILAADPATAGGTRRAEIRTEAGVLDYSVNHPSSATSGWMQVHSPGDVDGNGYWPMLVADVGNVFVGAGAWLYIGGPAATVTPVGAGAAPGSLPTPILYVPVSAGLPRLGNNGFGFSYLMSQTGAPGLLFISAPITPTLAFPPNYIAYVDLASPINIPFVVSGVNFLPLSIPADPSISGLKLAAQAISLGGAGWEFTQGLTFQIGN